MRPKVRLQIVGLILVELGILEMIKARIAELKKIEEYNKQWVDAIQSAYRASERLQKIVEDPEATSEDLYCALREESAFLEIIRPKRGS